MSGKEESRFYVELFLNPGNNCKEICEGFKSALFASTSSWGILESRPTNCVEKDFEHLAINAYKQNNFQNLDIFPWGTPGHVIASKLTYHKPVDKGLWRRDR